MIPLAVVVLTACVLFIGAYFSYGKFLSSHLHLDASVKTPAVALNDGIDFVPAKKGFLLGQHFSAIAAAGPIVGPILGALYFGWLPALLWIVFGSIFFGAVHDFASLAGSVRHGAGSIVEMMNQYLGKTGHLLFLIFVWLSLLYVITAFTDLTSSAFLDPELGGGTASSSMMYLFIGIAMGVALYKMRMPLLWATVFFLGLVLLSIAVGPNLPLIMPSAVSDPKMAWNAILLGYCFIASLVPVWILLQPRGYLGGFFLYGTLGMGLLGLLIGGEKIQYPLFLGFVNDKGMTLFPILFVTVACGACSGFHGIVCSGTTSKQIEKETDCRLIGYGGMLLEGMVAVLSLATVMILGRPEAAALMSPDRIYAEGLSRFVNHLGIPLAFARSFALLAFATFIYDTLDVATRLARQIFQEIAGWKGWAGRLGSTAISLAIPFFCVSIKMLDPAGNRIPAWKVFWTIFGTSNQLLAALTLMMLSLWLKKTGKNWLVAAIPMAFMTVMTLWSLGLLLSAGLTTLPSYVALALLLISLLLIFQSFRTILK